ncbi:hypothetical protein [Streptomyces sp. 1222.2]|uniref:hypothetical protein n=1 Tax=Streptomyces sp. 1222.2 TaxID=1938833 RepID=UPI00117F9B7B|nr:hypothetical protein [Streptomyces sp. 1222.2]
MNEEWQYRYTIRASIEAAPLSQYGRAHGSARRFSLPRPEESRVRHVLATPAGDIARVADRLGTGPGTRRRTTRFAPCAQPHDPANIANRVTVSAHPGPGI